MKKITILLFTLLAFGQKSTFAQLGGIDKLTKQGSTAAGDIKNTGTSTLLANLDQKLKTQFNLDGAKSQIVGDAIITRVADSKFNSLSTAAKTKQGNQMMDAATGVIAGSGTDLKGMGVKTLVLEVGKAMNKNEVLQTFKKPL